MCELALKARMNSRRFNLSQYVHQAGDKLLSINDVSTEGMTHVDAKALLKNVTGTITLKVMPQGDAQPLIYAA